MTSEATNLYGRLWKSTLLRGILALVVGALILLWPGISILVTAILLGIALVVWGIAHVVFAFTPSLSGGGRALFFVSGAAALIVGVLAFRHLGHGYAVLLLAIWIGVGLIFQGIAETVTSIGYHAIPGRGWHIFSGIITFIAGMVLLAWPMHSIAMLALIAGIWLIIIGITQIASSLLLRKAARALRHTSIHASTRGRPE